MMKQTKHVVHGKQTVLHPVSNIVSSVYIFYIVSFADIPQKTQNCVPKNQNQ